MAGFDLDSFVAACRAHVDAGAGQKAIHDEMRTAFADVASVRATMGVPERAGVTEIYRADDLTIIDVVWRAGMTLMPHNHNMWALIGVYAGREDNIFWRRLKQAPNRIEAAGARALCEGDVCPLGRDIIHSVTNPLARLTGAIHVYGGDFFAQARSEWDAESLTEQPYDIARLTHRFGTDEA